ncbi:MAG: aspartate carbamoyltransferase regulatory subunit [Thermofilaceae archaeon]
MGKELKVSKIRNGTVIDHIDAGRALHVLKILGLDGSEGLTIAVVMNVPSHKLGRKDIVKIEGVELRQDQVSKIALIAPSATINIVKDYEVAEKVKVQVPHVIEGLLKCANPNCITNQPREPVKPKFIIKSLRPLRMFCSFCGVELNQEDAILQLTKGG